MIRFLDLKAVTELHAEEIGRPADECESLQYKFLTILYVNSLGEIVK